MNGIIVFDNDDTNIPLRKKGSESILEKHYREFQMYYGIDLKKSIEIVKSARKEFSVLYKNNLLNFRDCLNSGRAVIIYSNGPSQWFYCAIFMFMQLNKLRNIIPKLKIVSVRLSKQDKLNPDLEIQSKSEAVNYRLSHIGVLKDKLVDEVITGMPKKLLPNTIYLISKPTDASKMEMADIFQQYKLPVLCIDDSKENLNKFKTYGYETLDCCLETKNLTNKSSTKTREFLKKWLITN